MELLWTPYSHGITQGFSLWQYPQLSVLHILLPRLCNQLITSLEPHKSKLAPSPYGLGELFWWLQALPDAPLSLADWGTAKLPHQGMPIRGCLAVRLSGALLQLTGKLWRTTGSLDTIALRGSRNSLAKQFQRQISCPKEQAWSLLSAQDPPGGKTKAIHPSKVLRSGIPLWGGRRSYHGLQLSLNQHCY